MIHSRTSEPLADCALSHHHPGRFSDDEFSASWDVADPDDDFTGFDEEQV